MSQPDEGKARFVAIDFAPASRAKRRPGQGPVLEVTFLLVVGAWLVLAVTHLLLR